MFNLNNEIKLPLLRLICNIHYGLNAGSKRDQKVKKELNDDLHGLGDKSLLTSEQERIKEMGIDLDNITHQPVKTVEDVILDIKKKEVELYVEQASHQDCEFDLKKHKEKYTNYLEIIIYADGKIEYANPSHTLKMINIICEMEGKTIQQVYDEVPQKYYADIVAWLNMKTGAIPVWYRGFMGDPNPIQLRKLKMLKLNGVYGGPIITKRKWNSELEVEN